MAERNREFGRLLTQGLKSIAAREDRALTALEEEMGYEIGYTRSAIEKWRQGYLPADSKVVEQLARACVRRGGMDRRWLQSFLHQARHPDKDTLIAELFPGQGRDLPTVHHNLPARWGSFLGRGPDLEAVLEALHSPWPVILISGMPGVGKTTLALEVAYACAGQPRAAATTFTWPSFDYIVWIGAAEQRLALENLLDTLAHRLEYPGLTQRPLAEKRERIRDVLAQQPVLLIVDDFQEVTDHAVADFLTRVPPSTKVLLTGREAESLLPPAFRRYPPARIPLGGLPDAEALTFLRQEAQRLAALRRGRTAERERLEAVVCAEDAILLPLVKATEGNPKALSLALGYIADQAVPLPVLVHHLYAAADSVAGLFDYFFSQAWERCTAKARALWQVISFFPAPARREALRTASGLRGRYFQDALEALQARSLVEAVEGPDGISRYRAHPLARAYGQNRLNTAPEFEEAARERWVHFYITFAQEHEIRDWDDPSPFRQLEAEWPNVLAVFDWLYRKREHKQMISLLRKTWRFMHISGYWEQRIALATRALELAQEEGDEASMSWLHGDIGWTLALQDRFEEARHHLDQAFQIAKRRQDPALLEDVYSAFTLLGQRSRDLTLVQAFFPLWEDVLSTARIDPKVRMRSQIEFLFRQATVAYDNREFAKAQALFAEMVQLAREVRWDRAIAYGLNYLGELAIHRRELDEAHRLLEEGWQLILRWQDKRIIAYFQRSFALLAEAEGDVAQALNHAHQAYDLFQRLGMRQEEVETQELIKRLEDGLASQRGAENHAARS